MSRDIFSAISNNDIEQVRRLVERGVGASRSAKRSRYSAVLESAGVHQRTPLIDACACSCYDIAKYLVDAGANVNAADSHGTTALMLAAYNSLEMVAYLVEHGANVNARTKTGQTALLDAAVEGQAAIVQYLLAHGADINARNSLGMDIVQAMRL